MHSCDVLVHDISVSRLHATLRLIGDAFYLEDNNSKFGTLIEANEPIELEQDTPTCLQIGRTVITLILKQPKPRPMRKCEIFEEKTEHEHENSRRETRTESVKIDKERVHTMTIAEISP